LLTSVTLGLVDGIARRAEAIDPGAGTGAVYEACRREDLHLLHARRLWRWYAAKLDQRTGANDDPVTRTLRAADELTWSCWKTAFQALSGVSRPPAAPIPYLAPQFSAFATPRTDPPPELRPGTDELLRKHIEQLPIPVIGLPPSCQRRPWWLIVAAHETSHHVQFEQAGLEELTQEQIVAAARSVTGNMELAEGWLPWCRELFADACSVLLTGSAAIWAIAELEMRSDVGLRKSPSGSYPPPLVRLAVARAVAERVGLPTGEQVLPAFLDSDQGDDWIARLLASATAVADALLDLKTNEGRELRFLGAATRRACDEGVIEGWRKELLGAEDPLPEQELDAARFCAAATVDAWRSLAGQWIAAQAMTAAEPGGDPELTRAAERLAARVLKVLPDCREPGTRAAAAVPDAAAITHSILADLDEADSAKGGQT
jgi:hypothetical protein